MYSKTTELVDEYKKNLQAHRIDLITRKQSFKNLELKQQAIQKLNRVNNDTNIIPILETCMTMLQHGLDDLRNEVAEHLFVHDFDDFDQEQQLQAGTTTEDETEVRSQKKGTTSGAESSTAPQPPKRRRRRKSKFIRRKKKKPKLVNDPRLMVEGIISPHEKGAMLKGMFVCAPLYV